MKIVFVCSGNTCRSPLALAAWRALQREDRVPRGVEAICAGLSAFGGEPATSHSLAIADAWGEDIGAHRAQSLSRDIAREADAILTMTESQAQALREGFDIEPGKVHLLGEFAPASPGDLGWYDDGKESDEVGVEILDPFGGSREAYETCAMQIKAAVEGLAAAIARDELSGSHNK